MNTAFASSNMTNIKMFNDKMVLSTAKGSKNILLWAENSGTIAFTYTDDNLKTHIPRDHLLVIGRDLYSEYFIYLHENKSLFTIWSTDSTQFYSKFSVSDERISSIDLSFDSQLLSIATLTGMMYFYDLCVGFLLKSSQISKGEIYVHKQHSDKLYALDKDKLSVYLIGKLLNHPNDTQPKELLVYYQSDTVYSNMLLITWADTILLWNCNQMMLLAMNTLTPIKTFRLSNKPIDLVKVQFASSIELYCSSKNELFVLETSQYANKETHQITFAENSSILLNESTKGALTEITAFEFGSKANTILTGHDDGKIRLWSRMKNKLYSVEGMYNIHKGPVMNILIINKPISQYGLNFNKSITENIISKVQVKNPIEVPVKLPSQFETYVDDLVASYTTQVIEQEIIKCISHQETSDNKAQSHQDEADVIPMSSSSSSQLNKYLSAYLNH